MLSFNGPPPARQSHIKKMLNCKNFKPVQWTDVILLEQGGEETVLNCSRGGQMDTTA